jgi:dGTPase
MTIVRERLEEREELLSLFATRATQTKGRLIPEEPCEIRTDFQRDRDRIVHCNAFRRIKHKTQVFIAPQGDHFVTRLTHTLEVAQIARTISRALNLNEDLTEAMALGHDMGHTPFGHIGEDELNKLHSGGFRHNHQSLRIVDKLEKEGKGLNLTWEVRQGILHHSKPRGDFLSPGLTEGMSLEAQVIRISDAVAYLNHDLLDAFRAGVLTETSIPRYIQEILGERHSQRINTMVNDIVTTSQETMDSVGLDIAPEIKMGVDLRDAVYALREFMFQNVYVPEDKGEEGTTARKIIDLLFGHYHQKKHLIPEDFQIRSETFDDAVKDYISGMTDQYAIRVAESVSPGIAHVFKGRTL